MNATQLQQFIIEAYDAYPERLWTKYPDHMVFRHADNRKWFALVMNVTKDKLGLPEKTPVDVLNVKCEPFILGSLLSETGFYPAYHMNKSNWITIVLDGSVPDEKIEWLLDMSYELTAKR